MAAFGKRARPAFHTPPAGFLSSARTRTPPGCSRAKAIRPAPTGVSSTVGQNSAAKRLSTAFDSVTLYGQDPDEQPDIYGKVGNSGVSICTLDDMKGAYGGFELCDPNTGLHDHQRARTHHAGHVFEYRHRPAGRKPLSSRERPGPGTGNRKHPKNGAVQRIRGTVQADILKEDQGQNTCIFSIDFALKMMGDIQEYFIENNVRNFYSVSISGTTLPKPAPIPSPSRADLVQRIHLRGILPVPRHGHGQFAPNLSPSFLQRYGYRIHGHQPRGPPHLGRGHEKQIRRRTARPDAQVPHPDHRAAVCTARTSSSTTSAPPAGLLRHLRQLQLLHTNAFDEAITTPSDRIRAQGLAIQLIINREWGLTKNENMNQGVSSSEGSPGWWKRPSSTEFDRISARGGVLGAMETGYQRSKIQEESMYYEMLKHTGRHCRLWGSTPSAIRTRTAWT
jgi:methylmalonyl-CoA mutase